METSFLASLATSHSLCTLPSLLLAFAILCLRTASLRASGLRALPQDERLRKPDAQGVRNSDA